MRLLLLQSVVLQAGILYALSLIINHEISNYQGMNAFEDPVLKNYTDTFKHAAKLSSPGNITQGRENLNVQATLPSASHIGSTLMENNTNNGNSERNTKEKKSFYKNNLPKQVVANALFTVILYYWHLLLEYFFPTRPGGARKLQEKSAPDRFEYREEEVMKSLIEKGKVRRASISWGNTLAKWFIEMSAGTLWQAFFHMVTYDYVILDKSPFKKSAFQMAINVFFNSVATIFTHQHIASLFAFVVVPAPQRPVFMEGTNALVRVFIQVVVPMIFQAIVKTKFVQGWLMDMTEQINKRTQNMGDAPQVRLIDEL